MTVQQHSSIRQRVLTVLVAGIGAIAASAVSFAMAVYEAAHPEPLRQVSRGESIDTGRWVVSILGARIATLPPTGIAPMDPKTFLTLELDLENRGAASAYASTNLLAIDPPVSNLEAPTFYLARDKWIASPIHPGIGERMFATWEWPAGEEIPKEVTLVIGGQIYKRRDNLYGASGWLDGDPVASLRLPVEKPDETVQ